MYIKKLFFVIALSLSAFSISAQADSTINPEELIDPTHMEAPGIIAFLSDSSLYLIDLDIWSVGGEGEGRDTKYGKEKTQMTIYFDPKTVAMKIEFAEKVKRSIDMSEIKLGHPGIYIKTIPVGKVKQAPMYFDNNGFVYVYRDARKANEKGYMKAPFDKFLKKMPSQSFFADVAGLPGIGFPDGSVTYYGMDVSPKKFPILEWVFVYKTEVFEGNDAFTKEIVNCATGANCVKYTLSSGADSGSYVLFDSKQRLREISTKGNGYIIYNYQEVNVKLPDIKMDLSTFF